MQKIIHHCDSSQEALEVRGEPGLAAQPGRRAAAELPASIAGQDSCEGGRTKTKGSSALYLTV